MAPITLTWKDTLQDDMADDLAHEIDIFEGKMFLTGEGKLSEKVFAESRLRRGVYGQRYDNGQRHNGFESQKVAFPSERVKGPDTYWDAPGMMRIKVPYGGLNPEQLEVIAQLADEYSDSILHVTTRQDIQLHFVHIEDTPDLMRRLAAVGITTREACGNSVRNVTCCQLSGVCRTEAFDATPYADALTYFLLGHDDVQDFGRKFKIAFSGCEQEACGLVMMHDMGFLAQVRTVDGKPQRGFKVYVGGGLGTVPHQAKLLSEFTPEGEILPQAQAVSRVFARLGEKTNRNRARLKFLIADLGIEEFRRLVEEERKILPHDDRWTGFLETLPHYKETPRRGPAHLNGVVRSGEFNNWYETNVYQQRQEGYAVVTVNLPLGDLTTGQSFALADIARKYVGDSIRTTVEQNIVLRWVPQADLPALYDELKAIGLGAPGAGTIVDITSCPGTDTCKLGIAASRGLAGTLLTDLTAKSASLPDAIKGLKIKISGCFNSCGQHHVADIGFFGNSRRSGNHKVPHFQVVLGGRWRDNGGSYGLAVGAVPSKSVPQVVGAVTDRYVADRERGESFQDWIGRIGKKQARAILEPFMSLPVYELQPEFFSDWGDPRVFSLGDIGIGECAGEVVSLFSMEIALAESEAWDAQLALEEKDYPMAEEKAYRAMVSAARALVKTRFLDVGDDPDRIVDEFKTRFYDTQLFFDPFAKGKFAHYLLDRHAQKNPRQDADAAHRQIEAALLFIEATHTCESQASDSILIEL
ncbi:MAG: nitrite/sulfite reductase [Caldilineaceae bacterium]|nr:nitrite/sulfite reductase [Caldilineaceae bacterium]